MGVAYEDFQLAVLELATSGMTLTVANVSLRTRLAPVEVEPWLDRMVREGRLEAQVEPSGVVIYRAKGLTLALPGPLSASPSSMALAINGPLPRALQKSVVIGSLLGLTMPGAGLAYCAPWWAVLSFSAFVWGGAAALWHFTFAVFGIAWVALMAPVSSLFGALFTYRYNRSGNRKG